MNIPNVIEGSKRSVPPPFQVLLKRGSSVESIHTVHAVVCDEKGRVLLHAGRTDFETYIRSALKPFQTLPFIRSGAADKFNINERGLAISTSSHSGSIYHAREVFKILWNSGLDVDQLQCPTPINCKSPLQHNCSGKHASFLATCKKMNWPLENYLQGDHPLQIEIFRLVADILKLPPEELVAARDDCGAPTLLLHLSQMAMLYAHLANSSQAELEQVTRAIISHPELIAGKSKFDTELISRAHGQLVSKGGAEGIQCLCRVGEGLGIAIKAEDGAKRAKHAVSISILKQLDWLTPSGIEELEEQILLLSPGVQLEVHGSLRFVTS